MTIGALDYNGADIRMLCTSPVEREKRLGACAKERETIAWLESIPTGSILADVGANVGSYSLVAGKLGLFVSAFEPHGPSFQHLVANIDLNGLHDRVRPYSFALSDHDGGVAMKYASDAPGAALHEMTHTGVATHDCYRLDSLVRMGLIQAPQYIKIDTDGSEGVILAGAEETLRGVDSIQIEVDDESPDDVMLIYGLCRSAGLTELLTTRHGATSIRNVLFTRA